MVTGRSKNGLTRRTCAKSATGIWRIGLFPPAVIVACLAVILPKPASAEFPHQIRYANPITESWRVSRFRELDGRGVCCLTEDQQGNMWFGLQDGVAKYDGYHWTFDAASNGLPDGSVKSIASRQNGTLVAATSDGLYRFSGDRWQAILNCDPFPRVTALYEDTEGTLWACCSWGLIRHQADQWTLFTSSEYAAVIEQESLFDLIETFPDECLPTQRVFEGSGIGLFRQTVVFLDENSPAKAAGIRVGDEFPNIDGQSQKLASILRKNNGDTIQVTYQRPGLAAAQTVEFTAAECTDKYRAPAIHSIMRDSQRRLWIGAVEGRVLMSDDDGASWRTWNKTEGLKVGDRPTLLETRTGEIWAIAGERRGGLCRFDGDQWSSTELTGLFGTDYFSSIKQTVDGTIWVTALNRLHVFCNGQWSTHDTRDLGFPIDSHQLFVAADDAMWILGRGQSPVRIALSFDEYVSLQDYEFHCLDADGAEWFVDRANKFVVRRDSNGTTAYGVDDGVISGAGVIVAVQGGVVAFGDHERVAALSVFDGSSWHRQKFPDIARDFSAKGFQLASDGRLWIAARGNRHENQNGGVIVGRNDQWEYLKPPGAPRYATSINELPDGRMMFGGGYGVVVVDGKRWSQVTDALLRDTACPAGVTDRQGAVWFATRSRGLLRYMDGRWDAHSGDTEHSLYDINAIAIDLGGQVLANTADGIFRYDGTRFRSVGLPKELGRKAIQCTSDGGVWLDRSVRFGKNSTAPIVIVDTDRITTEHNAKSLVTWRGVDAWNRTAPDKLTWSYRMDGGPWSAYSSANQAVLEGLSAGNHTLQVRGRDADMNVSKSAKSIAVVVASPIWMRWWFLAMAAAVVAALILLTHGLIRRGLALRTTNGQLEVARAQLANQFAEKSAQFRAICDCSPIGIFVSDTKGQLSYANRYLERILGFSSELAKDVGWVNAVHPDDRERIVRSWEKSVQSRSQHDDSGRFLLADGQVIWFRVVADCIEDSDGEILGYVGAVENVSERVLSEQELKDSNTMLQQALDQVKQAQEIAIKHARLTALGQMAAGVAHDINNSLSPLLTYAELLVQNESIDDKGRDWAEFIRIGVTDMSVTVKRLDHFYRTEHDLNSLTTEPLVPLVAQTVELTRPRWDLAADGKSVDVQVSSTSTPHANVVPSQLRSVITNLIFNAVDAIEQDGRVVIRVFSESENAVIEVEDNGEGMDQEQLGRCLEPFFTTKSQGSGLGLSECHGIVGQHGGWLEIESSVGRGTLVRIRLPLAAETTTAEEPQKESPVALDSNAVRRPDGNVRPSVLYIDDDALVRDSAVALLNSIGVAVQTAIDGPSGLDLLEHAEFQLVMCDRGLPGMDGVAVVKEIKKRWSNMPVVMVSGWSQAIATEGAEPDAFLEKPVAYDDLIALLKDHSLV